MALGAVVSSIVNVAMVLVALPQSSVAVKVTVAAPVAPQSALNASKSLLQVTPLQASVAEAPPLLASQASRSATLPAPSHSTVASIASESRVGEVVSSIVNVAVVLVALPQSSVAVKVTVAAPVAPQSALNASKSLLQVTPLQASVADSAAVAGEPSVEVGCVASAVAFNRRVHRVHHCWCRRVFDRERCRGARGVAAVVRRSEGDCCRTRCSAIGAQRVEVVAPGHSAASVRCRSAAVAGEPSVEVCAVASTVAFNRRVHRVHHCWCRRVFDRERCRGARGVAAVVRRSEGDCCRTRCSAIGAQRVEVVAPGHSAASVRCRSAAVAGEPSVEVGCVASAVAFNRRVHRVHHCWCRRVFDRERCRGARGVAAVVRRSEGDCCRTRCSAIGAQRVEVVAPGHSAASVRCRSAAVAGEPSVEVGCVASAVAFNRRVHRFRIARWRGRVFDRERCRGARGVAAVVRRSEGDCCRTRCSAIGAQRVEVVAPGHSAASVRCRSAAVAGEPSVEVGCVASTVAFNRRVHRVHHCWCRRVFDRERCRGARGVAAVVRRSEGDCCRTRCSAIGAQRVEVVAPGHSAASVRCRSAAVAGEPSVEVCAVASTVAFNRRVHRIHYSRCRRVFDRERCRGARGVAAVVRRSEHYCRCSSRSAIGAQRVEVVAPGHSAASVRCRSAAVAGEPSVEVGCVASAVAFNRRVHRVHHCWCRRVFDRERCRGARGVAAVVRRSEGDCCRTRCSAIVAQRVEVVAPGHSAASVRCRSAAVAGEPSVEVGCVASAVAFNRRVHRVHYSRCRRVFDCERCRGAGGVAAVVRRSEGDCCRTRCSAIGAQRVEVVAPGYSAASVRCRSAAVAGEPSVEIGCVPSAVAFNCHVHRFRIACW